MKTIKHDFDFKATGIGSVPSTDICGTCRKVLESFPDIPFWPQFVKNSPFEDMSIQFSEALPLLYVNKENRSLHVSNKEIESELTQFYEHYLSEDMDYFRITKSYSVGLYKMIEMINQKPDECGAFIKGQTVGPATFAAGIMNRDGKSILSDENLLEAYCKGLAIKALWQVKELEKTGKRVIIFLDEPYLSGFGSAFSPIQRHDVIRLLDEIISYLKEKSEALVGIHCCGNTDWSMLIEAHPHIINFDAYGYMDYFLLYPKEISGFINSGGIIAWGIVPTADFTGDETLELLHEKLQRGIKHLSDYGIDPDLIRSNSILTPACGMGSISEESADKVLELVSLLSRSMT